MVLSMPIKNTVKPSVLNQFTNGNIPRAHLDTIEPNRTSAVYLMAILPARGMRALHSAALKEAGIILTTTGRSRTYQQQYDLFMSRYTKSYIPGRSYKTWNGVRWYLKAGMAMAAVPGTSPHGWSCADDLAEMVSGKLVALRPSTVQWLYGNARRFGFAWSTITEQWHVQWVMGDVVPQGIIDYEKTTKPTPEVPRPPTTPIPKTPIGEDDMSLGIIRVQDYHAVFKGWTNTAGNFLQIEWVTSEDELLGLIAAGAKEYTYPLGTLKWLTLIGPVPNGDVHQWIGSDFKNHVT